MYDVIRLHYDNAVTSQLFWLAPLSDEILDVVTSKKASSGDGHTIREKVPNLREYLSGSGPGRSSSADRPTKK
jgi:hypothetical protein